MKKLERKVVSGMMLSLLMFSILTLAFNVQPAKAWMGTVYIMFDGTIFPSDAPIQRDGDLYTLFDNIFSDTDGIIIERNDMTLDGKGYTLQGHYNGIYLSGTNNVTIQNVNIKHFQQGCRLYSSSSNTISGNNITQSSVYGVLLDSSSNHNVISGNNITSRSPYYGVGIYSSTNNTISGNMLSIRAYEDGYGVMVSRSSLNVVCENDITNNGEGIRLYKSSNNKFHHNNFKDNTENVHFLDSGYANFWDDGYPYGGNYWSDYVGVDEYLGPDQNIPGNDGICDTQYVIDVNNHDNYPLMNPCIPGSFSVSIYTDNDTYAAGETMQLGLDAINPNSVKYVCFAIWIELPDSSIDMYMHEHSVFLPIGTVYNNPAFDTIILPDIPAGTYTWHVAFLDRTTHTILAENTAEWQFV